MSAFRAAAEAAVAEADRRLSDALPQLRATVDDLSEADPGSRSLAHRALGHALLHGGRADEAVTALRASARLAHLAGEPDLVAAARTKLAYALHVSGRLAEALRQVDRALAEGADEVEHARALGTRALIHRERGEFDRALADLNASIAGLRRLDDDLGVQRALINRALVLADSGAYARAGADLSEAEQLALALGRPAAVGLIVSNRGYLASRAGDLPGALAHYARAEQLFVANGMGVSGLLMDRAELLTRAGLEDEALRDAQAALAAVIAERRTLRVPEVRLLLAQAAAAAGEASVARDQARAARDGFRRQGRAAWAAAAGLEVARATHALGRTPARRALLAQADTLAASGWTAPALEGYLLAASLSTGPERTGALRQVAARRRSGPALLRARGWYAQALLAATPAAATRAVDRGLAVLDEHLAGVGADDLRAGLIRQRLDLAGLGVDLALAAGSPSRVFAAVEQARAFVLVRDTVRAPADPQLDALLARHRTARRERDREFAAQQVRDHVRTRRGGGELLGPLDLAAVDAAAPGLALVAWFARAGRLHALTRVDGRTRLHELGPEAPIRDAVARVGFAVNRLAGSAQDDRHAGAARALLAAATQTLGDGLLALPEAAGRPLVLVPPAFLHAVPWQEIPAVQHRPVTVAASVMQWVHATRPATGDAAVLVAAGPGLPGARAEAEAVAAGYGVSALVDDQASVDHTLQALAGARLAHLATHGWLRADNPQFSELSLADGALVVHHLDTIDSLPATLVLASCDTGRPVTRPGEALLGFTAACLVRGTRTVIAPVAPVPDGSTATVMTALHHHLRAGLSPADALATAQQDQPPGRRAFVCFGAGTGLSEQPSTQQALGGIGSTAPVPVPLPGA